MPATNWWKKHANKQSNDAMVVVKNVDMVFNIANEQLNSLKEYFIALVRGKLFFREFKALEDVSFTVNRGDVYGIVGTNGSGKSTLLKVIAGVLEPTRGTCEINGTIAPLIELGAGFDLELTARENVYLNGSLLGYSRKFIDEHFDSIIDFAEIEGFVDMPLKNYSSGMVARIAFAIATATIPDILVVDEALSVGDFVFQEKCERRIKDLVENHGTTLLFVSHSIDQVERVCEKALWIEKGHKRMSGTVEDVCFAYRNMEYADFVVGNRIMELNGASVESLKGQMTLHEALEALFHCSRLSEKQEGSPEEWAANTGLLLEGNVSPSTPLLRRQATELLHRYALWRRPTASDYDHVEPGRFSDALPEESTAREAVEWCVSHRLMSGIESSDGALSLSLDQPIQRIAFAKMIVALCKNAFPYPGDVNPLDWYAYPGYLDFLLERAIMGSTQDGTFRPYDSTTRGQAIVILWRCVKSPAAPSSPIPFEDVPDDAYFSDAVRWAASHGIITEAGKQFDPDRPITVQEYADYVYRFAHSYIGLETVERSDLSSLADIDEIAENSLDALSWCFATGQLEPRKESEGIYARPHGIMSRAQTAFAVGRLARDIIAKA